jgi:hypothetical protein
VREAPTIVLIGAGSASFGLTTLHDLYAEDGDGETYAFVKQLHERFGAVVATSDSHAGEYLRSTTEYTEPLDIAARQRAMRTMIAEVVDTIIAGTFDLDPFLR